MNDSPSTGEGTLEAAPAGGAEIYFGCSPEQIPTLRLHEAK